MSIYFEKAREFAMLLLNSQQGLALEKARHEFKSSHKAVIQMEEFNAYQANINESIAKNVLTNEEKSVAIRNVTELAAELKKDEIIGGLVNAENEFNGFVNQVMDVMKATLYGNIDENNNTRGCGGCRGCGKNNY